MSETTTQQPGSHEEKPGIIGTIDTIASATSLRVTGLDKVIRRSGPIEPGASVVFTNNDRLEGEQETAVPLRILVEAYDRITSGTFDIKEKTYYFEIAGQQMTMPEEKVGALTKIVLVFKLQQLINETETIVAQGN